MTPQDLPFRVDEWTPEQYQEYLKNKPTESKFHNKKVLDDGYKFDSLLEHKRYLQLKRLQMAGQIKGLRVHPRYQISVNGVKICVYEADFEYKEDDRCVTEDVKGVRTRLYVAKKALMLAVHKIKIVEITKEMV